MSVVNAFNPAPKALTHHVKGRAGAIGSDTVSKAGTNQCREDVKGLHTTVENIPNGDMIPDRLFVGLEENYDS